jgi:glutathione S-transferase
MTTAKPGLSRLYELWQSEWCPASRRVRQRLTELGIDCVIRQAPVEREDRVLLRARTGSDTIPVLFTPSGESLVGEQAILGHLDANEPVPLGAEAHRQKAEKARRRYLDDNCARVPGLRSGIVGALLRRVGA